MTRVWLISAGSRRQIGPLGTIARIVGATVAITLPVALDGFGWSDAAIALVALPLVAAVAAVAITAGFRRLAPSALASSHAICSGPGCGLLVVMVLANGAFAAVTSANGTVTLWVWLGVSMLLAAARGYAGCEVLAIPNLITGRRDQIGCMVYTLIDAAEARHGPRHDHRVGEPTR